MMSQNPYDLFFPLNFQMIFVVVNGSLIPFCTSERMFFAVFLLPVTGSHEMIFVVVNAFPRTMNKYSLACAHSIEPNLNFVPYLNFTNLRQIYKTQSRTHQRHFLQHIDFRFYSKQFALHSCKCSFLPCRSFTYSVRTKH